MSSDMDRCQYRIASLSVLAVIVSAFATATSAAQPLTVSACSAVDAPVPLDVPEAAAEAIPAQVEREYRELAARAIAEFDGGRFAEARAQFMRAHELWPSARTLRTLAMTAFELGMYPRAVIELRAALEDERRALPKAQREQLSHLLEHTRELVGCYDLHIAPQSAELLIDGSPIERSADAALLLNAGRHELVVRAADHAPMRVTLEVAGRARGELVFELEPIVKPAPPPPSPPSAPLAPRADLVSLHAAPTPERDTSPNLVPALSVWGVAAASFITAGVFMGISLDRKHELDQGRCPDKVCPPAAWGEEREMRRFADLATVLASVGAAGTVLGAYLWFSARSTPEPTQAARVQLRLHPQGAAVAATF